MFAEKGIWKILGDQLGKQYARFFHPETLLIRQLPGERQQCYSKQSPLTIWFIKAYSYGFYTLLLILGITGIITQIRHPLFLLFTAYIVYYLLLFLVMYTSTRYRIQIEPVLAAFGGVGANFLINKINSRS